MYSYTKFKPFCKTSDYETKFAPQNVTGKDFEKANIKIVTRIQQCTPAPNFRWFQDVSGRS